MLQSKGIVRRLIEDKNDFLVSFANHDGYFHADDEALREEIRRAYRERREIAFTYGPTLKILSLVLTA